MGIVDGYERVRGVKRTLCGEKVHFGGGRMAGLAGCGGGGARRRCVGEVSAAGSGSRASGLLVRSMRLDFDSSCRRI